MRIGGCSFAFGPRPLEDAARIVRRLGFQVMDLGVCLGNTQINPMFASEQPEKAAREVREVVERLELELEECFLLDFGQPINHPDPEVRREVRTRFPGMARFARLAGCRSIML